MTRDTLTILHVLEAVEGGIAIHLRDLATTQARRGHRVIAALPETRSWGRTDKDLAPLLRQSGVETHRIDMAREIYRASNARALSALITLIRSRSPDVVHTHATVAGILGRVAAWRARVPAVHTQNGTRFGEGVRLGVDVPARTVERALSRTTAAAIAVSESEADNLAQVLERQRIAVVPNGIAATDRAPAPWPSTPAVVSVCRFEYPKDPLLAVRVMAAARRLVPAARALLIGYGELDTEVRALTVQLDPEIEVRSDIPGPQAAAACTVVLLCSQREGAPYVLLEAMERSRPVVATNVVGSRDIVVHGETGFLFPRDDVGAGAAAVARLLRDPILAQQLGGAGRRRLEERYTVDRMVDDVDAVYRSVVDRGGLQGRYLMLVMPDSRARTPLERTSDPPTCMEK